jgi:hypothetical protein
MRAFEILILATILLRLIRLSLARVKRPRWMGWLASLAMLLILIDFVLEECSVQKGHLDGEYIRYTSRGPKPHLTSVAFDEPAIPKIGAPLRSFGHGICSTQNADSDRRDSRWSRKCRHITLPMCRS